MSTLGYLEWMCYNVPDIMEQSGSRTQMGNDSADGRGRILTVGHSTHDWQHFRQLLRAVGVTAVADVRSQPHSRWCPQYNRGELERALAHDRLVYFFLGDELGGRPQDPGLYDEDGRVQYEKVRQTELFRQGLERVLEIQDRYRLALLCSEEDPLDCHRGLMIAPALVECRHTPAHLRGDGGIESMSEFEERLLQVAGSAKEMSTPLFDDHVTPEDRAASLVKAYRRQARRQAFRRRRGQAP
jgi:hypothetical protein